MLCPYNCNLTTPFVFPQKVQSDHHEVVADLIQTSFLFSIPTDGPMSFSTPRVSVQWILRFEFLTTPKSVDLSRYYSQYSKRISTAKIHSLVQSFEVLKLLKSVSGSVLW